MRAYRQIAKNNSYLAAVSSGQSQGTTVVSDAITVNARVITSSGSYPSKMKVSASLLAEISKSLDAKYFTNANTSSSELSNGAGLPYARKVSVHEEKSTDDGSQIFTSLGDVNFWYQKSVKGANLYNTKMATVPFTAKKDGVIKSVGIDVVTNSGVDVPAGSSVQRRVVLIPNPLLSAYVGSVNFYYKPKSCFFTLGTAGIYKIPFDLDTFTFGTPVLITTSFPYNTTYGRFAGTNTKNKLFKQISSTQFMIFNMDTETVTTVTTNRSIPSTYNLAWDRSINALRYTFLAGEMGWTLTETGFINIGTGVIDPISGDTNPSLSGTPTYYDNNIIVDDGKIFKNNIVPGQRVKNEGLAYSNSSAYSAKAGFIILDEDNVQISFTSSANTSYQGSIVFDKFPQTMYAMIGNTPDIPVVAGEQITVEFDFNILT